MRMIWFQYPELLLLAIPAALAYRRWGRARGVTGALRLVLLALLVIALAGPQINLGGHGIDVIVVADRSRSMTPAAQDNVRELIHNIERPKNRGPGDRVAVVTFGSQPQIEHDFQSKSELGEYVKEILPDGSDLAEAISTALALVDKHRPARILVLSDGEANGSDPISAARRAREEGVPIDFRAFERARTGDVAVESLQLPESVAPREPFQFAVDVYADHDGRSRVRLTRDGQTIANSERSLTSGRNRLQFRDLLEEGGAHNYRVEVETAGDPEKENNTGAGVVFVDAGPRVLVLNSSGKEDNFLRALRSANIPVDVAAGPEHPLTQDALDRYRAVVIENVPAVKFGRPRLERLAQFVEDLGGGLLLTGGERSFGVGGFFKSPLDNVLPVSMELRHEHRKNRVAIAVALDRSGSMMAPVGSGKTKMDLADLGTAECVRLLSPGDMASVIAIDSVAHVVQPITPVEDPEAIAAKALRIRSEGGGIFIYVALVAAGEELTKAGDYTTRHIILFADANDSEEPGDYKKLLRQYADAGITVSVIGLGTEHDKDSALLKDIASLGGGNILFSNDPLDLPRLFTQDTMSIARNTFIKKTDAEPLGIDGQFLSEGRLMGELGSGAFPHVDGYNLCYLKPEATQAVVTNDEYKAPFSAFWYRGLGRAAALTIEVDGTYSGEFARWKGNADFLVTHVRWLLGNAQTNDAFVKVDRAGQEALVTVELDPDRPDKLRAIAPKLAVVPPGAEREASFSPDFVWTGPDTLEARFRLDHTGTYRTLVKTGDRKFTRGPAVTLPYSPEFVPRPGLPPGIETLQQIAEVSGGKQRSDVLEVLADPPRTASSLSLIPWLMIAGIALLCVEIAGRRLSLWERASLLWPAESMAEAEAAVAAANLPRKRFQWRRRLSRTALKAARDDVAPPRSAPSVPIAPIQPTKTTVDVFQQAKDRARRRSNS